MIHTIQLIQFVIFTVKVTRTWSIFTCTIHMEKFIPGMNSTGMPIDQKTIQVLHENCATLLLFLYHLY